MDTEAQNFTAIENLIYDNYRSAAAITIRPIARGEENLSYYIAMGGEEAVLRVYSRVHTTTGWRERAEIEFELRLIEHMHAQGVLTPQAIPARDGSKVAVLQAGGQDHFAVLFEYARGEEPPAYTDEIARSTAETLMTVRRGSLSFPFRDVRPWPGDMIATSLGFYAANRPRIDLYRRDLDRLSVEAESGYAQVRAARLPRGVIHGDIRLGNLLFAGSRVQAVLDFDEHRESYLLEELARTLMHELHSPVENAIRSGHAGEFLDVFGRDPSVSPSELAHLGAFLKARFVYDASTYLLRGHTGLVGELLTDPALTDWIGPIGSGGFG